MQQFLIDFVVEQTGYPPEIVDMDSDLEADLGIDSIKKAQLFGELREMFTFPAAATAENNRLASANSARYVRYSTCCKAARLPPNRPILLPVLSRPHLLT